MRLWRWIRGVIADRGEHAPVPVHLERGHGGEGYAFRLGVRAGFGGQETARIPVHVRVNESPHPILKEVHYCEVAGRTLEAANVYALKEKVATLLDSLAPARTLPLAYFRVPAMDYSVPVYEDDGKIVSPVIGGPKLKADDLAGIRRMVCRYLMSAGYVTEHEAVTVGVVRPRDLSLVPPAAIFRSLSDRRFLVPRGGGGSPPRPPGGGVASAPPAAPPRSSARCPTGGSGSRVWKVSRPTGPWWACWRAPRGSPRPSADASAPDPPPRTRPRRRLTSCRSFASCAWRWGAPATIGNSTSTRSMPLRCAPRSGRRPSVAPSTRGACWLRI